MSGPTREEVEEWAVKVGLGYLSKDGTYWPVDNTYANLERFAALAFAAGSRSSSTDGAELVREIETNTTLPLHDLWPRIRTALLSAARSGEDARDAARWRKHMEAMRDEMSCLLIRMFEGTAEDYEAAIDAAMGAPDAKS